LILAVVINFGGGMLLFLGRHINSLGIGEIISTEDTRQRHVPLCIRQH
jgi:hypothetical protein